MIANRISSAISAIFALIVVMVIAAGHTYAQTAAASRQAVVETTAGTFVIDLAPEQAPLTTAYFMKIAAAGGFNGTIFHKMIKYGIVQGGDPLSRDPAQAAKYGSGGLGTLTTTDISTVIVAFAAGVAGMLAFETRAAAAVGVAISITTIPAIAYMAVAVVADDPNDAWGALGVLVTNVLVLLAAGTLTVSIQRMIRARQERHAPI